MLVLTDFDLATRPCSQRRGPVYLMGAGGPRGAVPVRAEMAAPPPPPADRAQEGARGEAGPPGQDGAAPEAATSAVDIRNYFPETWLWELQYIGNTGNMIVQRDLPHSITEWVGSTFCTNSNSGLGVSKLAKIKTFQPFFVSFTLPYSVIRNEIIHLPVTVFNYLTECLAVELTMGSSSEYDIIGSSQAQICVCGSESNTHTFQIMMKELGQVNVSVSAVSVRNSVGVCMDQNVVMSNRIGARDAVSRELLVEPEGREMEYSYSEFFCLENNVKSTTASLALPSSGVVPGSARAQFSVIGDVMGPTLAGLERLLRMPMGCGEQNMLLFAPNIYVLQYLTNTQQLTSRLESRAKGFMTTGYQRELKYRHRDGSYSAFGDRDPEGSTWLTGFVVKSFAQAKPYIFIDESDLNVSISWFKQKQQENGCFPQIGRVIHSDMKGGLSSGGSPATLTAYILISLLEAGIPETDQMVVGARRCLEAQTISDTYTIALMAYAYSIWDPSNRKRNLLMDELERRAISSDGMKHWTKSGAEPTPPPTRPGWFTSPYHKVTSADVEMSAYALMAYLTQSDGITQGLPIVKWLSSQRSAHGGFKSTQDTVVALQALAQYASKTYSSNLQATVTVTGQNINEIFIVNAGNRLVLQRADVSVPNSLTIEARGTGCFFAQANVNYNIFTVGSPVEDAFNFAVTASRTADNNCKKRSIRVCAKYNGPEEASNMAVVEVKMVSGWVADKESIGQLMNDVTVQLKKFEIEKKMVNFYFDELTTRMKCFSFTVTQEVKVSDVKPGIAKVYDYYKNELKVMDTYTIRDYCGTKEELPFVDQEEFDRLHRQDPSKISQVRVPAVRFRKIPQSSTTTESLPDEKKTSCPQCLETVTAQKLKRLFCNASHAFKAIVRSTQRYPLKIQTDLRQADRPKLNVFANVLTNSGCVCPALSKKRVTGNRKVLVLTQNGSLTRQTTKRNRARLELKGENSIILPMVKPAKLERILRKTLKQGRCTKKPRRSRPHTNPPNL